MVVLFSREECLSAAPGARRVRGRLYLPTNPQRQALPRRRLDHISGGIPAAHRRSLIEGGFVVVVKVAATNKCLAQMNKSGTAGKATKKARNPASQVDPMGADHRVVLAIKQALSMLPQ